MAHVHDLKTRHMVLKGKATSVRLELIYWLIVDQLAKDQGRTSNQIIEWLKAKKPDDCNSLAAWIRVVVTSALRKTVREMELARPAVGSATETDRK